MAKVVSVVGVGHNPFLPRLLAQSTRPPGVEGYVERFAMLRERLRAARPDRLVVVASDHMHALFTDNMPPFLVGKAPEFQGIFPNETREWGLAPRRVPGDVDLARHVIEGGLDAGVDLAFSNEVVVDHGFVVPLDFLRPEMDLPVVPIFTNTFTLPMPRARRFHQVGQALRTILAAYPDESRIGVIASGHLSVEVGGPRTFAGPYDAEFDRQAVEWMRTGDAAAAVRESTFERLHRAGNATHGFLNFVLALGVVGDAPAAHAEQVSIAPFGAMPFFAWEPAA